MACAVVCFAFPAVGAAQVVTEVIDLPIGWNAVWFNVEPDPVDLAQLLAQQPPPLECQAVWTFDSNRDVRSSTASPGRWFFYDKDVPSILHTLRTVQGHRAYLINVNVAGQLRLTGRPVIRGTSFNGRVGNLFGTATDPTGGPLSFEAYFAHPAARGKVRSTGNPVQHEIFALGGNTLVRQRLSDPIGRNQAYWVNVVQDFEYSGPLDVHESANGVSFGRSTARRTLGIEVPSSTTSRTLSIRAKTCVELSGGDCTTGATGAEWLEYREADSVIPPVWRPLAEGLNLVVPPNTTRIDLEIRAQRANVALSARSRGGSGSAEPPPLIIDISDDQGSRVVIPANVSVEPVFGRWIGRADLTRVSTHPSIQNLPLEQSDAVPVGMTLLLDLPSPSAAAGGALPRLLDTVTIQTYRDGRPLQRRFASVLFDRPVDLFEEPTDPLDPFGATGTLRGTIHMLPEDPLNPYRHRYNPEHRKGYEITRQITVVLEVQGPSVTDELAGLDGTMGPQCLTGFYTEVITGVVDDAITVQGTFRLERLIGEPVSPSQ